MNIAIRCKNNLLSRLTNYSRLIQRSKVDAAVEQKLISKHDGFQLQQMQEMVIQIDTNDNVVGPIKKLDAHLLRNINNGIMHRGFSVLLFNENNEYLLTQRSDEKITFPGVYTNLVCSHPLYTKSELETENAIGTKRAALRRMKFEVGIDETQLSLTDLNYVNRVYYKVDCDSVWGEYEIAYVFVVRKNVTVTPNPKEVKSILYVSQDEYKNMLADSKNKFTPWSYYYASSFLYDVWNHLDDLSPFSNTKNILDFVEN